MIDGRFHVIEELGEGMTAVVYRCRDLQRREKLVAVKVLKSELALKAAFQASFRQEAEIVNSVRSPHIMQVEHSGTYYVTPDQEVFYYVTAWATTDLACALKSASKPLSSRSVLHILNQVASALDAVAEQGIAHGDVKPGNILLFSDASAETPHAQLADFGVARELELARNPDEFVALTPDYASKEQWAGEITCAGDQYALGCTLYEALCGSPPFSGADNHRHAHSKMAPPPITRRDRGLPNGLDAVFARVLAKNPTDRYTNCTNFVRDARDVIEAHEAELARLLKASEADPTTRTTPLPRRRPSPLAVSAVLAAAILIGVVLLVAGANDHSRTASDADAAPPRPAPAAYNREAMRSLRDRVPYAAAPTETCSPTQFRRTSMKLRPPGVRAAYTCDTPQGKDEVAFFQSYAGRGRLNAAFDSLARSANFADLAGATQVTCRGDDQSEVIQWELGRYVCLTRQRPSGVTEHWIVVSAVKARLLVAVVDVQQLNRAVDEWDRFNGLLFPEVYDN